MSDTLTLSDLEGLSPGGTKLAVLGHPIGHSLSPLLHNAALAELARTEPKWASWRYYRIDVRPEQLPRALALLRARGFLGLNLTVPHKVIAFDQVAAVDEAARPVGAVNTLLHETDGWRGFNTDGYGLSSALRAVLGLELRGARVLLLGAGGAARSAAVECLLRGCSALWIANRTRSRLAGLLELLRPLAGGTRIEGVELDSAGRPGSEASAGFAHTEGLLVINATSAGLHPGDPPPLNLTAIARPSAVYDMIYNPTKTTLLSNAESLRIPWANGLSMLVHQGAKALQIWTGVPIERIAPAMERSVAGARS